MPKLTNPTVEKMHYTDYFLTISTNVKPTSEEDAQHLAELLDEVIDELFSKPEDLIVFIDEPVDYTKIVSFKYEGMTEVGKNKKGGRIHWHGKIMFKHHTKIRVLKEQVVPILNRIMKEKFGERFKGAYYSAKWIASKKPLMGYITKGYGQRLTPVTYLTDALKKMDIKEKQAQRDTLK